MEGLFNDYTLFFILSILLLIFTSILLYNIISKYNKMNKIRERMKIFFYLKWICYEFYRILYISDYILFM